jgi:hypothetical protein
MTEAFSSETGTRYPSWEALLEAEANGHVVVAIISDGKQTWPYVEGPYPTKREATNARARMKTRFKKDVEWDQTRSVSYAVRPVWKPKAELEEIRAKAHGLG